MTKTSTELKICGVTKIQEALKIASLGVSAIGVIGVENSPRFLPPINRSNLFKKLNASFPKTSRVLVVADITDSNLSEAIKSDGAPSIIQLHGNESKERCIELKQKFPQIKWWKAFRIRSKVDLEFIKEYEDVVDALLLDSWSNNQLGGTGTRLEIDWLKGRKFNKPWWLAGGICEECIPLILNSLNPSGLDASSKLEIAPGIKNIQKIELLIKAIKEN